MARFLETLAQDLAYALRSFRRSPGFVLIALCSVVIGAPRRISLPQPVIPTSTART